MVTANSLPPWFAKTPQLFGRNLLYYLLQKFLIENLKASCKRIHMHVNKSVANMKRCVRKKHVWNLAQKKSNCENCFGGKR